MDTLDVIVPTSGGGIRAKSLISETLESFHEMVKFSGRFRILVHDDPLYLRPTKNLARGWSAKYATFERESCLEFRKWLSENSTALKITKVILSDQWQHIGGSIIELMSHVETPIYFHLEHDFVFLRVVDLDEILRCFRSEKVNMICFNRGWNELKKGDFSGRACAIEGIRLLADSWGFSPALARTAKMRELIERSYVRRQHASEDILVQAYREDVEARGFEAAQGDWGTYVYGGVGESPAVEHIGKRVIEEELAAREGMARVEGKGNLAPVLRLLPPGVFRVLEVGWRDRVWDFPGYKIVRCGRHVQRLPGFLQADLDGGLPFGDKAFDGIVAVNILGDLKSPGHFMRECARIIRDDGFIILDVPNSPGRRPVGNSVDRELFPERGKEEQVGPILPRFEGLVGGLCREIGLSIVSKTYLKDGRVVVKAVRRKTSRKTNGDRPEFIDSSPWQRLRRRLTKGWMVGSEPLGEGKVRLALHRFRDGKGRLSFYAVLKVKVKGAGAVTPYTIGLNVYGGDVPVFGRARRVAYNTGAEIFDGIAKTPVNAFVLGTLATTVKGKGRFKLGFPLEPGRYDVQIWVSKGSPGEETNSICYKSGETFGDSDLIAIEPSEES